LQKFQDNLLISAHLHQSTNLKFQEFHDECDVSGT